MQRWDDLLALALGHNLQTATARMGLYGIAVTAVAASLAYWCV